MPNNTEIKYTILGQESLLWAAQKECRTLTSYHTAPTGTPPYKSLIFRPDTCWLSDCEYLKGLTEGMDIVLTLPKDWDQLMNILDSLKQPKVPEYVRGGITGKHFKVYGQEDRDYLVYGVRGTSQYMSKECAQPITEEEFIQGGLKELEEAGFVVGAQVTGLENPVTDLKYITQAPLYSQSFKVDEEVNTKGFVFALFSYIKGNNSLPVGQCTLLPKVQTLPTTSQGIPYLRVQHTIHMGIDPVTSLHIGTLKQWKKLGITTLTLPCGTLTQEDLTKLASL